MVFVGLFICTVEGKKRFLPQYCGASAYVTFIAQKVRPLQWILCIAKTCYSACVCETIC